MQFIWIIAAAVFIIDQAAKYFFLHNLCAGQSIPVIKNIFHITLVYNTGIAFGLFKGWVSVFVVLSFIVITYIFFDFIRHRRAYSGYTHIMLGLIAGGACGNLVDRLRLGYVVDFLDFRIWPVFNIADSAITIGMSLFAYSLIGKRGQAAFCSLCPKTEDKKQPVPFF